jgi:hypothetical protein
VFSRDQVLELRNVEGRIHIARKERRHDEWNPPIPSPNEAVFGLPMGHGLVL